MNMKVVILLVVGWLCFLANCMVVFPACPTGSVSCELTSGQKTTLAAIPAFSSVLLYIDVPMGIGSITVSMTYPIGAVSPKLFYRPWIAPVLYFYAGDEVTSVCGEPELNPNFEIGSPPPGRYYFVIANDEQAAEAPGVSLTVTMFNCPLTNAVGKYCTLPGGQMPFTGYSTQIGNNPYNTQRPIASYYIDETMYQYPAWQYITVVVAISGVAVQLTTDQLPVVSVDYGSIGTRDMDGMEEDWREQTHAMCGGFQSNNTCTFSLNFPKRGRHYINVFPPVDAPGLTYTVNVMASVGQANPADVIPITSLNGQPLTLSNQLSYLYFDIEEEDNSESYTAMMCPTIVGAVETNAAVSVAFNRLPDPATSCDVIGNAENVDPHWFLDILPPGRYYVQLYGVPDDGSWMIRFTTNFGICDLPVNNNSDDDEDEERIGTALLITWLTLCGVGCCFTFLSVLVVAAVVFYNKKHRVGYETLNDKPTLYDHL